VSDKLMLDKNPMVFRVVEDGIRPLDDVDGNLVIDTSDGRQVQHSHGLLLLLLLCTKIIIVAFRMYWMGVEFLIVSYCNCFELKLLLLTLVVWLSW